MLCNIVKEKTDMEFCLFFFFFYVCENCKTKYK